MSDPASQRDSAPGERRTPGLTPVVRWLIGLSVALYFLQLTVLSPDDVRHALGFERSKLGHQWWTIATFLFVHRGFWPLALNVFALGAFGPRVERTWGAGEFLRYYLFCGLGGWFAHLVFVPSDALLLGSSAAVLGVMLAFAAGWSGERMTVAGVLPVGARAMLAVVGSLIVVAGVAAEGERGLGFLAQLGGLAAGWLYLRTAAAMNLGRFKEAVSAVPDEPDEDAPPRAFPKSPPRSEGRERVDDIVARSNAAVAEAAARERPAARTQPDERALDRLLDKISAHGLESLTAEERKMLEDASRRLKDRNQRSE
jgi:membrane associated rhomboid family serine protease